VERLPQLRTTTTAEELPTTTTLDSHFFGRPPQLWRTTADYQHRGRPRLWTTTTTTWNDHPSRRSPLPTTTNLSREFQPCGRVRSNDFSSPSHTTPSPIFHGMSRPSSTGRVPFVSTVYHHGTRLQPTALNGSSGCLSSPSWLLCPVIMSSEGICCCAHAISLAITTATPFRKFITCWLVYRMVMTVAKPKSSEPPNSK
jgi:hypothetical protein